MLWDKRLRISGKRLMTMVYVFVFIVACFFGVLSDVI